MKQSVNTNGIPIAPSLNFIKTEPGEPQKNTAIKLRLLRICCYSIVVAAAISCVAKLLVWLINVVTNISFYGTLSIAFHSPSGNHLGWWVIVIPMIGGILVGLMALYGSTAIRGHGIPEAMEQILTNQSRIKPSITFLKPISSAIAIGTGGPFGAEGPIIATGGRWAQPLGRYLRSPRTNGRFCWLPALPPVWQLYLVRR